MLVRTNVGSGKGAYWFLGIFAAAGLGMLTGSGVMTFRQVEFVNSAYQSPGEVVDLERHVSHDSDGTSTTYRPVVRFRTQEGVEITFTSSTGSNPPAYDRGESVEVLYNPRTPEKAEINGFMALWFGPLMLFIMGIIFSLFGGGIIFAMLRKKKQNEWLKSHGARVDAKITGINRDRSSGKNGRNPWVICAQWQDPKDGIVYTFESESIWFDPRDYVNQEFVPVWVHPQDPKKYLIDTGFLPQHV